MRTELPTDRLHRRLDAEPADTGGGSDDTVADDASLSRWLPAASTADHAPGWLATVRADPGRAGAIGLAVVGVVAVLVTVFTVMRDKPPPVVSAKLPPVHMVSSASPTPTSRPQTPVNEPVVVSVVGLVHKPGLVTLQPGARIADAVAAAGGTLNGADLIGLNMARRVGDGEQIVVGLAPMPGEPTTLGSGVSSVSGTPGPSTSAKAPSGPRSSGPVDLNSATVEQLDSLPGVGPVTAAAIVAWRDANGRFTSVDQLGDVDGIGPARLEKLKDLVRV
jgi:competence protein ComEA